jgi:myosin heavy subunit
VKYVAEGFLEKNKDSLPDTLMDTVKSSSMRLVRTLFRRADGRGGSQLRRSTMRKR